MRAGLRLSQNEWATNVSILSGSTPMRPELDFDTATDILFAVGINEYVYLRFTEECGRSPLEYAELIERVLRAALLAKPEQ